MNGQVSGIIRDAGSIMAEKASHRDVYTSTFVPKLGMILKGDHSNSYFGMPNADLYYAGLADATLAINKPDLSRMHIAGKNDPDSDYKRGYFGSVNKSVNLEYSAGIKKQLWMEAQVKKAKKSFIANGGNVAALSGMPPAVAQEIFGNKMKDRKSVV